MYWQGQSNIGVRPEAVDLIKRNFLLQVFCLPYSPPNWECCSSRCIGKARVTSGDTDGIRVSYPLFSVHGNRLLLMSYLVQCSMFNVHTLLLHCCTLYLGPTSSHALPCLMNRVYTLLHCCTLYVGPTLFILYYYIAEPCIWVLPCSYLAPFATSLLPFTQIPPTQSLVIWWTDVFIRT